MCGINGIFAYSVAASAPERAELIATRDHMRNRGPDGAGEWWNEDRRLGLGHRRLSIIDLSDRASQPMHSACGRYTIVFNGEIYNYQELRREIETRGGVLRTSSDTEVLLHLYAHERAAMVHRLRGMFAIAIWDAQRRTLFLARDPYGIKPLYTANDGWTFRFASQVKAMLAGGRVSREPDPAGVVGFHIWGNVPEPFTTYRDIRALPAGHTQLIDAAGPRPPKPYVSIAEILAEGSRDPAPIGEVATRVRQATLSSVRAHLIADVEVGLFLSAGVDSGALLGLMRDAGQAQVRTITLGFNEFRSTADDEAPVAGQVARLYGAEHIVRQIGEAEFRAELPAILEAMDQPTIDGVNTWFISKAAREIGLKVALSGVGGDELFAGYPSFQQIPRWVRWLRIPAAIPGAGVATRAILAAAGAQPLAPKSLGLIEYGGSYAGAYMLRRAVFLPFELRTVLDRSFVRDGLRRLKPLHQVRAAMAPSSSNPVVRVAALESSIYMRNQLLRDCDWAGMAHSLEVRTPLVDIMLLRELANVIPALTRGAGKAALASAPSNALPVEVSERAKSGFSVPTGQWTNPGSRRAVSSKGAASRSWALEVLNRFNEQNRHAMAGQTHSLAGAA